MPSERIGLFGGTFNPIHTGHIRAADSVKEKGRLDRILFIPSYIPPHKSSADVAEPSHRLRMVELALKDYPDLFVSSIEIEAGGKSYSVITIEKIKMLYPRARLFFILGIDAFLEIDTWKEYEKLIESCCFIVMSRPGNDLSEAKNVLRGKYRERMAEVKNHDVITEEMCARFSIFLVFIDALELSSTAIRHKIKRRESISGLVPEDVESYIEKHELYLKTS